jgi:malonyl-CoA/methylmalonyl-CoA synthetase
LKVLNNSNCGAAAALERHDEGYIAMLASVGYEHTVAILAVVALGAAAVPIASALSVQEVTYYVDRSHAAAVLASSTDQAKSGLL